MFEDDRLGRIETLLQQLLNRAAVKSHYTVEEFARMTGRAPFTVRQWANLGRITAEKSLTRCGSCSQWSISHEEYLRYQRFGLISRTRF
jgi:hypothetical protein